MTDPADMRDLVDAVRWLCDTSDGDKADIDTAASLLWAALLDLEAHRRGFHNQRRLQLARRVQAAKVGGASIPELMERFGKSRAEVYRLLSLKHPETLACFNPASANRR
jgi:hypothetical protein